MCTFAALTDEELSSRKTVLRRQTSQLQEEEAEMKNLLDISRAGRCSSTQTEQEHEGSDVEDLSQPEWAPCTARFSGMTIEITEVTADAEWAHRQVNLLFLSLISRSSWFPLQLHSSLLLFITTPPWPCLLLFLLLGLFRSHYAVAFSPWAGTLPYKSVDVNLRVLALCSSGYSHIATKSLSITPWIWLSLAQTLHLRSQSNSFCFSWV